MIKKVLKMVAAAALLLVAYAGYIRLFAIVAAQFRPASLMIVIDEADRVTSSETARAASRLAAQLFGANDWTTKAAFRYYNNERGYWMFAESYERRKDGRQIVFRPFAIIWRSKDGRTLKTVTGNEMIADFDEPFDVIKPGAKAGHVVHAQIIDQVRIRDDKGTPTDPSDDLEIGPLTALEFDEAKLQVTSDSDIIARDRDTTITGKGLLIELRPNEGTGRTGFNGAKAVHILKLVHIHSLNVGRSGILPGTAKGGTPTGPTPIDLQCAGEMKVVLPDPPPQAAPRKPGDPPPPPPPPQPTLAWFKRNVRVRRGTDKPDQLDCDELFLTLMPTPKQPRPASAGAAAPGSAPAGSQVRAEQVAASGHTAAAGQPARDSRPDAEGPLTELTLRRAEATGHAVWLQSEAQNAKVRGNQLIHEKLAPVEPDKTYMCGNANTRLFVEKYEYFTEGPNAGKLRSIDTIRTTDVTIFDNGQAGGGFSTIVARGPGLLETRAEQGGPVERSATWQDQCIIRTEGENDQMRRVITLYGTPHVADAASGALDANQWIMAWLKPQEPKDRQAAGGSGAQADGKKAAPGASPDSNSLKIERMDALGEAHLVQGPTEARPNAPKRDIIAHKNLSVEFVPKPPALASSPAGASRPANDAPAFTERAAQPILGAPQPAAGADADAERQGVGDETPPKDRQSEKPADPAVVIVANQVWARIKQGPGELGKGRTEVDEARLRGGVSLHQDPAPGKARGTDVTGDAGDIVGEPGGLFRGRIHGQPSAPARLVNDELEIEGPIIKVDQAIDHFDVEGAGKGTQMVVKGMLNEQGLTADTAGSGARKPKAGDPAKADDKEKRPRVPMVITWRNRMEFRGRARNLDGETVAKAQFLGGVIARSEDSYVSCEDLETFMDRPMAFARPKRDPNDMRRNEQPEPKPQVAFIRAQSPHPKKVVVVNIKTDPETQVLLEKQRIEGHLVTYDKLSGEFEVFEDGPVQDALVRLYKRKQPGDSTDSGLPRIGSTGTTLRPTAFVIDDEPGARTWDADLERAAGERDTGTASGRALRTPPVVGSRTQPLDRAKAGNSARKKGSGRGKESSEGTADEQAPALELTRIRFSRQMRGRFGSGKDSTTEPRQADFLGNVEILHGMVADENQDLDPDRPPQEYVFLTSHFLRVISVPPPADSKQPARNFLNALYNANAQNRNDKGQESAIQADQITLDTAKKLFYFYSLPGREVHLVQRSGPGQPPSHASAESGFYNYGTGQSSMNSPKNFRLFDAKVGTRAKDVPPPPEAKYPKNKRREFRLPPRSDKERRGFNGR